MKVKVLQFVCVYVNDAGGTVVANVPLVAQQAVPLGYTGIDICLDERRGPVVLEINARPGIEIQNALQRGLMPELQRALAALVRFVHVPVAVEQQFEELARRVAAAVEDIVGAVVHDQRAARAG